MEEIWIPFWYLHEAYVKKSYSSCYWFKSGILKWGYFYQSFSYQGVLRGLHYQLPPFAQSKLVSVIEGSVLDVVVDIRRGSPTFGQYFSQELNTENRFQMFIPRGFAHGFITLSKSSIFCYKVDNFFNSKYERSLSPDDPELDINWRLSKDEWIQSRRDKNNSKLANLSLFEGNVFQTSSSLKTDAGEYTPILLVKRYLFTPHFLAASSMLKLKLIVG